MFARVLSLFFFLFIAFPALINATAVPRGGTSCSTGPIQCCNQVGTAQNLGLDTLFGLFGIITGPASAVLGVGCSPITAIGVGRTSCDAQSVCCNGNTFNGLINVGCSSISA